MASISWNDMNDSSQMSDASSDDFPQPKVDDKNSNLPPTSLQKALSSPEPVPKHKFDPNQRIAENLEKLAKHNDEKVWLFVPNTFNNQQSQAEKILKDLPDCQKVYPVNKGFNIYLKTSRAEYYIQKGYYQKGINFRMIYSTRNDNIEEKRGPKKYSEKEKQGKNYEVQEIKSPRLKNKQTYSQRNNYPKERQQDRVDKKKVKYVAKDGISQKKMEEPPKIIQESNQTQSPSNTEKSVSVKSDVKIERQEQKKQQKEIQIKSTEQIKIQEQINQKITKKERQQSEEEKQKEQEKETKQKKKKNNKKKKGKTGGGGNSNSNNFDPNNPFSSLM